MQAASHAAFIDTCLVSPVIRLLMKPSQCYNAICHSVCQACLTRCLLTAVQGKHHPGLINEDRAGNCAFFKFQFIKKREGEVKIYLMQNFKQCSFEEFEPQDQLSLQEG